MTSSPPANPAHDSETPSAMAVANGVSRSRSLTWISVGPDEPSMTWTTIQRPSSRDDRDRNLVALVPLAEELHVVGHGCAERVEHHARRHVAIALVVETAAVGTARVTPP